MEKRQSKNKKIIIMVTVILIILAVILGGIGIWVNDNVQRVVINKEIDTINKTSQVDIQIKAKGKYADVEKVLKDYILEYQSMGKEIQEAYENEKFKTLLS